MEASKVNTGAQNEVPDGRRMEGNLSDIFWSAETSATQSAQNGAQDLTNPFLTTTFQNGSTYKPWNPFCSSTESKVNGFIGSTTVDPFSSQSNDSNTSTVDEENKLPSTKDLTSKQDNGWFQPLASPAARLEPMKPDCSPIPAKNGWAVFPPSALRQEIKRQESTSPNHASDAFQVTSTSWLSELSQTGSAKEKRDIFQPYKEECSVSQGMASNENTENTESASEKDYLLDYILSNQKKYDFQATPPTTTASSWRSDVFQDTPVPPVITTDIFQTPDGFIATPTSVSSEIFQTPLSSVENGALQDSSLFQTPTTMPGDIKAFDPLSDDSGMKSQETLGARIFRDLSTATPHPNSMADGGLMFRRRAPTPAPRIKVSKSPNRTVYPHTPNTPVAPPTTASAARVSPIPLQFPPTSTPAPPTSTTAPPTSTPAPPTPVPRGKYNIQGTRQAEKNEQVYEDILFIGQEKCVEDWPEDSPELSPDWKPAGKLKLRRDSMRISAAESEGALTNSLGRKNSKLKVGKKLRSSILSRRGSKVKALNKPGDDLKLSQADVLGSEAKERTIDSISSVYGSPLPWETKLHDGTMDDVFSSDQDEQSAAVNKSEKKRKNKLAVPHLHYRVSKLRDISPESGTGLRSPLQVSKEDLCEGRGSLLQSGGSMWDGKEKSPEMKDCRPKEAVKLKPSVHHQLMKDPFEDDLKKIKELQFLDEATGSFANEEMGATGFTPSWESKAGYQNEVFAQKCATNSMPSHSSGKTKEMQDCRPKKSTKLKVPHLSWKGSKGSSLNEEEGATGYSPSRQSKDEEFRNGGLTPMQDSRSKKSVKIKVPRLPRKGSRSTADEEFQRKGASLLKAGDMKTSELHDGYSELTRPPILRVPLQSCSDAKELGNEGTPDKGADLFKAGDCEDDRILMEEYTLDTKPQKFKKSQMPVGESEAEDQTCFPQDFGSSGATSSAFLSEAAKAEWRSSQMDVRRSRGPEDEEQLEAVEEEEEEGDTDSLMEWWNTVELWDEVPSDEEISLKEDETKSFTEIAGKVHRGLRVFYKGFTEQAEVLYQHVLFLYAIADDLSNFHRRAKIANITGGTTTAVGGVTAIAGLALAPVTFGVSLIVSAVGLGVATAGGIAAASAAISDNVHDMSDRKKIELMVQDHETRLTDLRRCLSFVAEGIRRMRCHPLLRRNNYYTGDWEVRRALQTISLVTEPVERAEEIMDRAIAALNNECKGMDKYFTKDSRELKKACKKELTARVRMLAKQLQEGLVELNSIREQLMDATGHV